MSAKDAFDTIVKETQLQVRAYIRGCGVPLDYVDDISQETYLAFYNSRDKIPPGVEPVRWLKGVARKLCLNYFRKRKRRESKMRGAIAGILTQTESVWEESRASAMALHALRACLGRISKKHRHMVALRYEERKTSAQIGTEVGLNGESVRKALHRVRALLLVCIRRFLDENEAPNGIIDTEVC